MKYFLIVLTVCTCGITARAQTAVDSVSAVINKMFAAMKSADGPALKECFSDSVVFQTISRNREGSVVVRNESAAGFVEQVSKAVPGSLDEQIVIESVKTDGPLAMVWTSYKFYYNGQFSHCGVNSFQLVRFNDSWKIQYIIDTRRKQGCE